MEKKPKQFLEVLASLKMSQTERAIALLWWHGLDEPTTGCSVSTLAQEMNEAGFPRQNVSRLKSAICKDQRTSKCGSGLFRVKITARGGLDLKYLALVDKRPIPRSSSVLPIDLFVGTRKYIENVVVQINASFDHGLFDCCAVMCRRLLETLIIEAYEANGHDDLIKGNDGHFLMFSGLLSAVESGGVVQLGRNGLKGLKDFKKLGDLSAHNRRYTARRDDIDRVRDGLRVASEDLVHIARLG